MSQAVIYIVLFNVLFLLFIITYGRAVSQPPGYAEVHTILLFFFIIIKWLLVRISKQVGLVIIAVARLQHLRAYHQRSQNDLRIHLILSLDTQDGVRAASYGNQIEHIIVVSAMHAF